MDRIAFQQAKTFIFRDIRREIQLANVSARDESKALLVRAGIEPGGGNFLSALGLLCYTEFGGKLKYNCKHASENFNRFFDDLGPSYKAFRAAGHNVYDIFRCGLAHEYYVKQTCTIAMLDTNAPVGIFVHSDGRYWFVVEKYCDDLERAFDALESYLYPNG